MVGEFPFWERGDPQAETKRIQEAERIRERFSVQDHALAEHGEVLSMRRIYAARAAYELMSAFAALRGGRAHEEAFIDGECSPYDGSWRPTILVPEQQVMLP